MKSWEEALYGEPERTLPLLCSLVGLATGLATRSLGKGAAATGLSLLGWYHASARLVIADQRLGPVMVQCPEQDPSGRPQVWLTFDDGPGPHTLPIIRLLNQYGYQATFFMIGRQLEMYPDIPELRRQLALGGHRVANHTVSHPNLLSLSADEVMDQLESNQRKLRRTFPKLVAPLFRPPFGYRNRKVMSAAQSLGLKVVGWNLNSLDFLTGPAHRVTQRVESGCRRAGDILLFHDGPAQRARTLESLRPILEYLKGSGTVTYQP